MYCSNNYSQRVLTGGTYADYGISHILCTRAVRFTIISAIAIPPFRRTSFIVDVDPGLPRQIMEGAHSLYFTEAARGAGFFAIFSDFGYPEVSRHRVLTLVAKSGRRGGPGGVRVGEIHRVSGLESPGGFGPHTDRRMASVARSRGLPDRRPGYATVENGFWAKDDDFSVCQATGRRPCGWSREQETGVTLTPRLAPDDGPITLPPLLRGACRSSVGGNPNNMP